MVKVIIRETAAVTVVAATTVTSHYGIVIHASIRSVTALVTFALQRTVPLITSDDGDWEDCTAD